MVPLVAQLRTSPAGADQRGAARRTLRLTAGARQATGAVEVLIHNLSSNGLLIETFARMRLGEEIQVELPEAGSTSATVVRMDGDHFGCRFMAPISKAAVSAALLQSPADRVPAPSEQARLSLADEPLRREMWSEIEPELSGLERFLLYAFLLLALAGVSLFIFALFTLSVSY